MTDRDEKGLLEKAKDAVQGMVDSIVETVAEVLAPEPQLIPIPVRPRRPRRRRTRRRY